MKIIKQHKGQTLIETAFVLFILMLIVLGTVEFARAWFTKNSMNNAARAGARAAVVTSGISDETRTKTSTPDPATCGPLTGNDRVFCYIWISPGIKNGTTATITITDTSGDGTIPNEDDTVTVSISSYFDFVIGGSKAPWPWRDQTFTTNATMRYE